jgi:hypothetical protein
MSTSVQLRRLAISLLPPIIVDGIRLLRRGTAKADLGTAEQSEAGSKQSNQVYWGLNELDRQIEKYLNFDGGYYVELGANDANESAIGVERLLSRRLTSSWSAAKIGPR